MQSPPRLFLIVGFWLGLLLAMFALRFGRTIPPTAPKEDLLETLHKLVAQKRYADALPLSEKLTAQAVQDHGTNHIKTAEAFEFLGKNYEALHDNTNAIAVSSIAAAIFESLLGTNHATTVEAQQRLGTLYVGSGRPKEGHPLLTRCLEHTRRVDGPAHTNTAKILVTLGSALHQMSDWQNAESSYQQSLSIYEQAGASNSLEAAFCMLELAEFYRAAGKLADVEPLLKRSLPIHEAQLGTEHELTGLVINSLANYYHAIDDLDSAGEFYLRGLKIVRKTAGADHPATALVLGNFGELYRRIGDFEMAERLMDESIGILMARFGPEHPTTASSLNSFANLKSEMGKHAQAKQLMEASAIAYRVLYGEDHIDTVKTSESLAGVHRLLRELKESEELSAKCLAFHERDFGPAHPRSAALLWNYALTQLDLGREAEAKALTTKLRAAVEKRLARNLIFTSERQRLSAQAMQQFNPMDLLGTLSMVDELAEYSFRTKGLVLDASMRDEQPPSGRANTLLQTLLDEQRSSKERLTQVELALAATQTSAERAALRERYKRVEAELEAAQIALARRDESGQGTRTALQCTIGEVRAQLGERAALLDFVKYEHYRGGTNHEPCYGVVVLLNPSVRGHAPEDPGLLWVPLGNAAEIESSVEHYVAAMRGSVRAAEKPLVELGLRLFSPLERHLPPEISTLVICPDGALQFANFGTFLDSSGRFLAERFSFQTVASARALRPVPARDHPARKLVAFANPDFNAGQRSRNQASQDLLRGTSREALNSSGRSTALQPLPHTASEAQFLLAKAASWQCEAAIYEGEAANESRLSALTSPFVLHLATHGFQLGETIGPASRAYPKKQIWRVDPMLRSCIALAGAQSTLDAWDQGNAPLPTNDGILSARELSRLDLRGTWLVVLSACDTGLGELRNGEGVLGLRRGFVQAGAQNLLMTLWPISDKWSVEIMKSFYEKAMATGDAPQAMAEVQAEWLAKLRKEKGALIAARIAGPFVLTSRGKPTGK
jgi:CHAT domain-containing protein